MASSHRGPRHPRAPIRSGDLRVHPTAPEICSLRPWLPRSGSRPPLTAPTPCRHHQPPSHAPSNRGAIPQAPADRVPRQYAVPPSRSPGSPRSPLSNHALPEVDRKPTHHFMPGSAASITDRTTPPRYRPSHGTRTSARPPCVSLPHGALWDDLERGGGETIKGAPPA